MSYRVTIDELRKDAPPLRLISITAPDWLQAMDKATEELSKEDAFFRQEEDETHEFREWQ